jgi:HTH-type transcriptional regulator/antitoxin HigA
MMNIRPIKTAANYQAALNEIENLFDATPNTPRGDQLEVLTTLVDAYEELHYPIPAPDPIEAVLYHMQSRGLTRKDLEPYIGHRARVSEILNRKRPLTLRMIQRLHSELGVSAEVLLTPYQLQNVKTRKTLLPNARTHPAGAPRSASLRARASG